MYIAFQIVFPDKCKFADTSSIECGDLVDQVHHTALTDSDNSESEIFQEIKLEFRQI